MAEKRKAWKGELLCLGSPRDWRDPKLAGACVIFRATLPSHVYYSWKTWMTFICLRPGNTIQGGLGNDNLVSLEGGNHRTCAVDLAVSAHHTNHISTNHCIRFLLTWITCVPIKSTVRSMRVVKSISPNTTTEMNHLIFSHAWSLWDRNFIHFYELRVECMGV